jgi:hypothetical protein
MKTLRTLCIAVGLLNACGNNSVTVNGPVLSTEFPFASVVSSYLQSTHDHVLTATSGGDTYTLTWHSEAGAPGTFEGTPSQTMNYTNAITKNGVAYAGSTLTDYFGLNPFKPLGGVNHTLGSYEVAVDQHTLPASALPGQGGPLDTSTKYADSSKRVVIATSAASWALVSDGASTAWACVNVAIHHVTPVVSEGSESVCYRIDASGAIIGVKMTVDLNGVLLTFR